jgi:hypothetical protein
MTEECSSCKKGVTKYILFEVSELEDLEDDNCELRRHQEAIVCYDCWAVRYRSFLTELH